MSLRKLHIPFLLVWFVTVVLHVKQGATKEEIVEALSVAVAVNAGAALIFSSRVIDAFNAKTSL